VYGYWLEQELTTVGARVIVALGVTVLKDRNAHPRDALGNVVEHGERLVVTTYLPSFALRAPDAATRERTYSAIVSRLRLAGEFVHERRGSDR
jgi:uracil-DNA glycosylase